MCVPYQSLTNNNNSNNNANTRRTKRYVKFNPALMKPDPGFVDERKPQKMNQEPQKQSFWKKLFS